MYSGELHFKKRPDFQSADAIEKIFSLLGIWYKNGQILDVDHNVAHHSAGLTAFVILPDRHALAKRHHNDWARKELLALKQVGLWVPKLTIRGREADCEPACRCKNSINYVLYSSYFHKESPIRCGDCFGPVPLYRFPAADWGEHYSVVMWNSDYRSCDSLQLGCQTGERFGLREMGDVKSSLAKRAINICQTFETATGKPFYYFLYTYNGRSSKAERERHCPKCGNDWLLPEPWHQLFDFRCDRCRLLGNIAETVRRHEK